MGILKDGVLTFAIADLTSEIQSVRADIESAKSLRVSAVAIDLLRNDTGWNELAGLFGTILDLPITTLRVGPAPWARADLIALSLGRGERPAQLEGLTLHLAGLSVEAFERLEKMISGLIRLDLSGSSLPDDALRALSGWSGCSSLKSLSFARNEPTARGIGTLAKSHLPALMRLDLTSCRLGEASVRRLTEGSLGALSDLSLASNPIGDEGVRALAESAFAEQLERLDVSTCGIGDEGARHLANAPAMRDVGLLDLRGNEIGDRGNKLLQDRFGARALVGRRMRAVT